MKIGFVIVLYKTPPDELTRLKNQIVALCFEDYETYFVDNTINGHGYAQGVNEGIRRAWQNKCELFIVANPDISFEKLSSRDLMEGSHHFDMWGLAMKQQNTIYYGGKIDRWRMSGGLISVKPKTRFQKVDFISGSLMLIKKEVIEKVGYLDESYFMYYEDTDYGYRSNKKGVRVGIDSKHIYLHFEISVHNTLKDLWLAKNRLRFLIGYGNPLQIIREVVRAPKTLWEEKKLIWDTFNRSSFLVNFFSMNASALLSKVFNFILFLVLIRNLTVAEYGIYTLVWAHVTILGPLVDFGTTTYGMVYLPQEKKGRINSLFSLRLFLSLGVFVLTILLAIIFKYEQKILVYIIFTSFVIFFNMSSGTYLILTSIAQKLVRTSALSIIANAVMIAGIILSITVFHKVRYMFATIAGFYLFYTLIYSSLVLSLIKKIHIFFDYRNWIQIMRKSYIFVLISFFAGIYFKIDVLLLSFLKGKDAVGVYSSGYKFLEALILIASSYNTVATPILAKGIIEGKQRLRLTIRKHMTLLGIIGFGVVLGTYLIGPYFFPIILKGNFKEATEVIRIIIWALPFILFNSVLMNLLYVSGRPQVVIGLFVSLSAINIVSNYLLIPHFSYIASSYITVGCELISLAILLYLVFVSNRKKILYD